MKSQISIIICLSLLFFSCTKKFDYNFNEKSIVVGCFLKANDTINISVSYSNNVGYNFEIIENAEVFIYEESEFKEKLTHIKEGEYKSLNFIPQTEKNYTLKVKVPDYDTVFASTYTPKIVKLDTITHFFWQTIDNELTYNWEYVNLCFSDNETENNYYFYTDYNIGSNSNDIVLKELVEMTNLYWKSPAYFDDKLINGEIYNLSIDCQYFYEQDTMNAIFEFGCISEEMFLFLKSASEQYYKMDYEEFLIEPALSYNNITNGIGIFAGYSTKKYERTFVKPEK